jgi:basic membrane lipoprotein Med (substrate-binding protein (PBP1-ABC) superfamily)
MPRQTEPEATITPEMLEAGADAILCEVGGADLGGFFSAYDLAERVYRAMYIAGGGLTRSRSFRHRA